MSHKQSDLSFMSARVSVPDGVVHRSFLHETVVLNLSTGQYHGLNPTAARMLDALTETGSVQLAATRLADDYQRRLDQIRDDLKLLCDALLARGLIILTPAESHNSESDGRT